MSSFTRQMQRALPRAKRTDRIVKGVLFRGRMLGVDNPKDKAKIARELRAAGKPVPFKAKKRKPPATSTERNARAAQIKARIAQPVKPKREPGHHAYKMAEKRANRRARRAPDRRIVMAANLSRNHPDHGLSMPEHLARKAERNAK